VPAAPADEQAIKALFARAIGEVHIQPTIVKELERDEEGRPVRVRTRGEFYAGPE
jgi:hypothetical protein